MSVTDDTINRARSFAIEAHAGQRYGDAPYVMHLDRVARILRDWSASDDLIVAGYLHDVLEDTPVSYADLCEHFGSRVCDIVHDVTGEGETRKARTASIYRKAGRNPDSALIKLADRIANVEAAQPGDVHVRRYAGEYDAFAAAFRHLVPPLAWLRLQETLASRSETPER